MPELPGIDPDLLDVVRDLERGAPSTLFALEPRKLFRAAGRGELPLRSGSTGLTSLDRHVLDVHRHELAYLLRWLFATEFLEATSRKGVTCPHPMRSRSEWAELVRRVLALPPGPVVAEGREIVADAVASERRVPALERVLAAALALEASPVALCYQAWMYACRGQPLTAARAIHGLMRESSPPVVACHALECLGYASLGQGRIDAARDWYRQAAKAGLEGGIDAEACRLPLYHVLMLSLVLDDERSALQASRDLEALGPVDEGAPTAVAARLRDHDQGLDSSLAFRRSRSISQALSPAAREFLHALA